MKRPPLTRRRRESGIALVIVMIVVISLSLLAGGFVMSMKVETKLARNAQADPDLDWLGRSGIEVARYVLAQSANNPNEPYDALNQFWAGGFSGTNTIPPEINFQSMALGEGTISIKIVDQERRFNINVADEQILQQGLKLVGVDASAFGGITGAILDWIDADDDTHLGGVETDFYQRLSPPYNAKNGPLDDISELLMINGVTPEMFWGNHNPHGKSAVRNILPGSSNHGLGQYAVGLADLFGAISNPRINLNTASAEVLQLIPGMDENLAAGIISARAGPDGTPGNEDDMPFRSVGELASAVQGMDPGIIQQVARYCDVRSATFQVEVTATMGGLKRRYLSLVRRNNPQDVPVLQFYWK